MERGVYRHENIRHIDNRYSGGKWLSEKTRAAGACFAVSVLSCKFNSRGGDGLCCQGWPDDLVLFWSVAVGRIGYCYRRPHLQNHVDDEGDFFCGGFAAC